MALTREDFDIITSFPNGSTGMWMCWYDRQEIMSIQQDLDIQRRMGMQDRSIVERIKGEERVRQIFERVVAPHNEKV